MPELLGSFEQVVLLAVLGLDDEAYGRAVLREVQVHLERERSVAAGAVYATLDRLEQKGYLSSRLEEGTETRGGRARRFYRLTAEGATALNETRATLQRMWKGKSWPLEVTHEPYLAAALDGALPAALAARTGSRYSLRRPA